MFSVTSFTYKRLILSAVLTGSFFVSSCGGGSGGDTAEILTDLLVDPQSIVDEIQDTVIPVVDPVVPVAEVEPIQEEPVALNATLSGRVVDAVTGVALIGATVTVTMPGTDETFTAITNPDGSYLLNSAPAESSSASFALDGYLTEQFSSISLIANTDRNLGTIRLVSNDNAGTGALTGTISNAVDGSGVDGLTLRFRQGINQTSGDVIATTTTDINGEYTVANLPFGNLTCEIVGVGFNTSFANVIVLGNLTQSDQNSAVSPNLSAGEVRIVLTWGSTPSDLDSHLTGPIENSDDLFHVYFVNRNEDLVNLDVDDISSFGPETVTVERQVNGVYRYSVRNFSNNSNTELSASAARVQVFDAGGLIRDFQVPDGVGDLWTVFDMEGGNITTVNTISVRTSTADHFPPSVQAQASVLFQIDVE